MGKSGPWIRTGCFTAIEERRHTGALTRFASLSGSVALRAAGTAVVVAGGNIDTSCATNLS
jgi:hypothetical protein